MIRKYGNFIAAAICLSALIYFGMFHALPRWADSLPVSASEKMLAQGDCHEM